MSNYTIQELEREFGDLAKDMRHIVRYRNGGSDIWTWRNYFSFTQQFGIRVITKTEKRTLFSKTGEEQLNTLREVALQYNRDICR